GLVPVYPAVADRVLFGAEHFLYLPLAGLVPLLVAAWPATARRLAPVVVAVLLWAWGAVTITRNRDWRDEETILRHPIAFDPPTARVWYNLANSRSRQATSSRPRGSIGRHSSGARATRTRTGTSQSPSSARAAWQKRWSTTGKRLASTPGSPPR